MLYNLISLQLVNPLFQEPFTSQLSFLSIAQNKKNKIISSVRAKLEHPFQIIKFQWKYTKTRYREIIKNLSHLYLLFGLSNLFKIRKILLAAQENVKINLKLTIIHKKRTQYSYFISFENKKIFEIQIIIKILSLNFYLNNKSLVFQRFLR